MVLVGDLVNKGPSSLECVQFARQSGFYCVRGNHDDSCLFAWERRESERQDGGTASADPKYAYTDGFDAADVAFLRSLPHTLRLPSARALVVHAGVVPGVPLWAQQPAAMVTMRNVLIPPEAAAATATAPTCSA